MTGGGRPPGALDTVLLRLYTTAVMVDADAVQTPSSNVRISPRMRSISLWAAALVVIVIGFADLAAGGTTVAAVLLVLGYCVLVPIAILK